MAKKKTVKKTPFGEMLAGIKQSRINPRTNRFYTNEDLAEAMDVSPRMVYKYMSNGAIPHFNTIYNLIKNLRLHPIDAIRLATTAGYDITVHSIKNDYLWDQIKVYWASSFDEEIKAKKRK